MTCARFRQSVLKALCIAFVMLIFCVSTAAQTEKVIRVGIYQNIPKLFIDENGNPDGFFVRILQEIAEEENWKLEFVCGTWPENMQRLVAEEINLMPDVAWSQGRSEIFTMNKEPVTSDWLQIIARPEENIKSLTDMHEKKIAVLAGSIQQELLLQHLTNFDMHSEIIALQEIEDLFRAVSDKRAQMLICNRFTGRFFAPKYGLIETQVIFHPTRLHFAAHGEQNRYLLDTIDRYLSKWKNNKSSVYYRLLEKILMNGEAHSLPIWLFPLAILLSFAAFSAWGMVLVFKYQLKNKTSELQTRNHQLIRTLNELQLAHEKAIQQEKMSTIGQMASGVGHDLNNVLMPITGLAQLMLDHRDILKDNEKTQKYLSTILEAGKNGSEIVRRMREFSRQHDLSESLNLTDLNQVIVDAVELSKPKWHEQTQMAGQPVTLEFVQGEIQPILGSKALLREIIVNLIFNAVDAMPEGGKIKIKTENIDSEIVASISDMGFGMPENVKNSCFKAFFTTKGEKGSGMGLSIAKEFCEAQGGSIAVDSAPGKGTTFTLRFPACGTRLDEDTSTSASLDRLPALSILVVDDDQRILEVIRAVLEAEGHRVTAETEPEKAIARAIQNTFDLMLVDFSMPSLNAAEVIKAVRVSKPSQVAIILTGSYYSFDTPKLTSKLDFILEKPFKIKQFREITNILYTRQTI